MFSMKYAKAWAGAFATLIATGAVSFAGGEVDQINGLATAIGGLAATFLTLVGPANSA